MHIDQRLLAVVLVTSVMSACGSDGGSATTSRPETTTTATLPTTTTVVPTTAEPATTQPVTTAPATTAPATTAPETTTSISSSTTTLEPTQLALWPAPDVVFATPEEAARGFLAHAFAPGPVIGPFQAGDTRSGEIQVFAADESGAPLGNGRSTLLMRQLGAGDGWFVLGAVSDVAVIATPEAGSAVPAGQLSVTGSAEGFEANIGIKAFVVGRSDPPLDETTTLAGNFGVPLPFGVTLDLSAAAPGDTVVILVHGGAGLETDPGDFAAIAVTVSAG